MVDLGFFFFFFCFFLLFPNDTDERTVLVNHRHPCLRHPRFGCCTQHAVVLYLTPNADRNLLRLPKTLRLLRLMKLIRVVRALRMTTLYKKARDRAGGGLLLCLFLFVLTFTQHAHLTTHPRNQHSGRFRSASTRPFFG